MIELARGMTQEQQAGVAALEREVVAADGGRLELEWGVLRSRDGTRADDLLWREDDGRVTGFLGVYAFGPSLELAGAVTPAARRRGIASALFDAVAPLCRSLGHDRALLVVPGVSAPGAALARRRGGTLEHSEHHLELFGEPVDGPSDPRLVLRDATTADAAAVGRLLAAGFGHEPPDLAEQWSVPGETTVVVERDGGPVASLRLTREGEQGGVYGFVVDPALQGRGIGRDVLRRACRRLRAEGATHVGLEVAVENARALGLYTSLGFRAATTEDYWSLPLPP